MIGQLKTYQVDNRHLEWPVDNLKQSIVELQPAIQLFIPIFLALPPSLPPSLPLYYQSSHSVILHPFSILPPISIHQPYTNNPTNNNKKNK